MLSAPSIGIGFSRRATPSAVKEFSATVQAPEAPMTKSEMTEPL
jgi:hypothetical protein